MPAERFSVCVAADGFEESEQGPFDPDAAPDLLECRLRPLPGVTGRVLAGGRPVASARVALHRANAPTTLMEHNGFRVRCSPSATTDAEADGEGRYHLTLRRDGAYFLRASAPGFADSEVGPLELRAAVGSHGVDVSLGPGGALEGRVLLLPGVEPVGIVVGASRGDPRPRTQRVGPDGRFRFERLTPGRWMVDRRETELSTSHSTTSSSSSDKIAPEPPWNCEVFEGQTTHFDLDLTGKEGRTLAGELRIDGDPAAAWTVVLRPGSGAFGWAGRDPYSSTTDRDGRFTLPAPAGTKVRISVESDPGAPGALRLVDLVEMGPGETPWRLDLPTGRLDGERLSAAGSDDRPFAVVWKGPGELRASVRIDFGADGRFALPRVPAGPIRIVRSETLGSDSDPHDWPAVLEATVRAGSTATVSIP